jgi:predicted nucleic acid-binding protein
LSILKIYLDTCSIQRPLDDKNQTRIVLESEAVLGILAECESGQLELVSSEALLFEINRNPHPQRKMYALEVLNLAKITLEVNSVVEQQAKELVKAGLKPLDALHVALATALPCDYFCTCDHQLLKRAKQIPDIISKIVSPLELIMELEQ